MDKISKHATAFPKLNFTIKSLLGQVCRGSAFCIIDSLFDHRTDIPFLQETKCDLILSTVVYKIDNKVDKVLLPSTDVRSYNYALFYIVKVTVVFG